MAGCRGSYPELIPLENAHPQPQPEAEPPPSPPPPPLLSSPLLVFSFVISLQLQAQALPLPQAMLFPQTDQETAPKDLFWQQRSPEFEVVLEPQEQ